MVSIEITFGVLGLGVVFTLASFVHFSDERTIWGIFMFPMLAFAAWMALAFLVQDVVYVRSFPIISNSTTSGATTTYEYETIRDEQHYGGGWPLGILFMGMSIMMLVYVMYTVLLEIKGSVEDLRA
jgi:hypothetical protein